MKVWSLDITIAATLYVKADTVQEAIEKAKAVGGEGLELAQDESLDVPISGRQFSDENLPEISISPAMMIQTFDEEQDAELSWSDEEDDDDD